MKPSTPQLDPATLPKHVAIIMDGNGRWAQTRGLPRSDGHRAGGEAVRPIVERSAQLGIQALTLYSFSSENWARSTEEVDALMHLYVDYLIKERDELISNNVRIRHVGRREGLPTFLLNELDATLDATAHCTGLTLGLALNYGSRAEITDAVQNIAKQVQSGQLNPADIDEALISHHLDTAGLPDPDLLIRTAGEMRVSNYLLWQISYAEFVVSDVCWPEFTLDEYHKTLQTYANRTRKFGTVPTK